MSSNLPGLLAPFLNREDARPGYRQLQDGLRDAILAGDLKTGERLPSSRALAQTLSISRNTVIAAYQDLEAEGFLEARTGAGTFVARLGEDVQGFKKADNLQRSAILDISQRARDLLELGGVGGGVKDHVPFASGMPALEEFPFDVFARLQSRAWRLQGKTLALHSDVQGLRDLRDQIARYAGLTRGVNCTADNVFIVNGAQQALYLCAMTLLKAGDRLLVEDPGFPGVDGVIRAAQAVLSPTPIDEEGMILPRQADARAALVTPSRNHPLGTVMSLPRRMAWLDWAERTGGFIIEDDYDSEFQFGKSPVPALQSLDTTGRVIYVGTLTRALFPALRLGFMVVPQDLVEVFSVVRSYMDRGTGVLAQAALAAFFKEGLFAGHIRKMNRLYTTRGAYLQSLIHQEDGWQTTPSQGGFHLVMSLNGLEDDKALVRRLRDAGLAARPLSGFYRRPPAPQGLVLGFAGFAEPHLAAAFAQLKSVIESA